MRANLRYIAAAMTTMTAIVLRGARRARGACGSSELPIPSPAPGEVRVRIRAVALNHLDIWVRRGGPAFKLEYPAPARLRHRRHDRRGRAGRDGRGRREGRRAARAVVRALRRVPRRPRQPVPLLQDPRREHAGRLLRVHRRAARPTSRRIPSGSTFPQAAAAILPFLTAWQMVVHKARVAPGETVLVHGAGSGIGVAAIQIAKLHGARVIATASTDDKLERARGSSAPTSRSTTRQQDFVAECRELTDKRGVDAVIEHVGGEVFATSIRAVRDRRPHRHVRRDRGLSPRDRSAPRLLPPGRGARLDDGQQGRPARRARPRRGGPLDAGRARGAAARTRRRRASHARRARARSARWCSSRDSVQTDRSDTIAACDDSQRLLLVGHVRDLAARAQGASMQNDSGRRSAPKAASWPSTRRCRFISAGASACSSTSPTIRSSSATQATGAICKTARHRRSPPISSARSACSAGSSSACDLPIHVALRRRSVRRRSPRARGVGDLRFVPKVGAASHRHAREALLARRRAADHVPDRQRRCAARRRRRHARLPSCCSRRTSASSASASTSAIAGAREHPPLPYGDAITLGPWLSLGAHRRAHAARRDVRREARQHRRRRRGLPDRGARRPRVPAPAGSRSTPARRSVSPTASAIRTSASSAACAIARTRPSDQGFRDSDGDGVLDKDDDAPYEPEDEGRLPDEDGAPSPTTTATASSTATTSAPSSRARPIARGCPAKTYVKIEDGKIVHHRQGPVPRPARRRSTRSSDALLDQIAQALDAQPAGQEARASRATPTTSATTRSTSGSPRSAQAR